MYKIPVIDSGFLDIASGFIKKDFMQLSTIAKKIYFHNKYITCDWLKYKINESIIIAKNNTKYTYACSKSLFI